jgi:type III restriction enzyme
MNRHVNAIAGRLSLRAPQRRSLEILDRIVEIAPPAKDANRDAALHTIQSEFPSVTDFERDFPSVCFALATGVGKTRLMGAFISYLHLAHGKDNFFVLAPNLTVYRKLIADFTPNTPKYVFKGIAEFATNPPEVITGDDYESRAATLFDRLIRCKINVFNIAKISAEVRGGRSPRIKRLSEYIGESYFEYLSNLPDLILLMDESHRYRASAGARAINELRPLLGLELTATPYVESARGAAPFRNVIYGYALPDAMRDGFVKEPAVVTRRDFNPAGMSDSEIELIKLEDGIRLHESVKVELETYARSTERERVKPFVLVIARDTTHAGQLVELIQSNSFFEGRYRDRVIQVDSSRAGAEEEAMIEKLLKVERTDEPTEIVVHVNMLKEGWDVTNLYTIVPLRAANARVLIEQSIGRGLRLPYGVRTGVIAVDRLNIVAHDRFQEIVDEANRPDSPVRLARIELDPAQITDTIQSVAASARIDVDLGIAQPASLGLETGSPATPIFATPEERRIAEVTAAVIQRIAADPALVPTSRHLSRPEIQSEIARVVSIEYPRPQMELGVAETHPDVAAIVARTTEAITQRTIDIPRILVVPKGDVRAGFERFTLDLSALRYTPVSEDLYIQHLRTGQVDQLAVGGGGGAEERRLEDYVVSGLVAFSDVSYDAQADLLYDLAGQVVQHFRSYLPEDDTRRVLRYHQRDVARFVHAQMQPHFREEASGGYEVQISRGVTPLKRSNFTASVSGGVKDYRFSPDDKANISRYLFGGFAKCLYEVTKFQSDPERVMAQILERDSAKWMRPAIGQFQIYYRSGGASPEYQPDFVAETASAIYMIEVKARHALGDADVAAKKDVAITWCRRATEFLTVHGGKPWKYVLVPHDAVLLNFTLETLVQQFGA